ncbi:TetR/AcrR family transcriptional regulator [Neolewinella xylanilytica]|nr:TetR/AcrR family transcriptional regulator [Neolewinella xylanilytica]
MARTKEFDEDTVLDKARDLFWERGYHATSIQDLEAYLGISRSSLYRFFGGKRELYDRTLARYQEENFQLLRRQLGHTKNLKADLTNLLLATARQYSPDCAALAKGCYLVNATTEMANACSRALDFVADNRERFVDIVVELLAAAQRRGELDPQADPKPLANYLFLCYNGLQVVVQTRVDRNDLVATVTHIVDALPWTDPA